MLKFKVLYRISITGMILFILSGIGTASLSAQGKGRGPSLVRTSKVEKVQPDVQQNFVGTLMPVRRTVIGSAVDGRIESVRFEEGDRVGQDPDAKADSKPSAFLGQTLVEIRKATLDIEIEAAKIELELRKKALEELKVSIPKEIELAKSNVENASALLEYSRKSAERFRGIEGGGISGQEIDQINSQIRAQNQSLLGFRAELEKLQITQSIRINIGKQRVAAQEAELKRLADLRSKYSLRAPYPGSITRKLVEKGDWVTRGQAVAELVQLDPIELRVNVPQEYQFDLQKALDRSSVESPLQAAIRLNALPQKITGRVVRIVAQADPRTRAVPVIIRIENPKTDQGYLLKPGLLAEASIQLGPDQPVLMIDKDALVLGNQRVTVFVLERAGSGDPKVRKVNVETGVTVGKKIAVSGDLQAGDEVVVEGNERLRPGQAVKVIPSGS